MEINELKGQATRWENLAELGVLSEEDRILWLETRRQWIEKEKTKSGMLKQKARVRWIFEGDENSKYFHSSIRRKYNKCNIRGLIINGLWNEDPSVVKQTILAHFKDLFSKKNSNRPSLRAVFGPDLGLDAADINSPYTAVHEHVLGQNTEVGPADPASIIGLSGPAGATADGVQTGPEQIGLGQGTEYSNSVSGSQVDFEKAFDSLNWDFLIEVMGIMGFGSKWRKWILTCFKSASISILVNDSPTNEFNLERGVRQGDPLSPFLFILATEGLNVLAKNAVEKRLFSGVEVGMNKVIISHLQYADDTIFFGVWNDGNIRNLMKLLKCFELTSGLKVNYHKSNLIGIGVDNVEVENVARIFGCKVSSTPFIYLGLPVGGNMKRVESWALVVSKFEKRLSDWKARSVSFGGRLTLVKAVLNSLPLYYFSLFRAPPCVIKHLESVRRSFFWGGAGNKSKLAWVKWDDMILPYCEGGLNLGSLKCKNMALIGKWWWRFKTETNSLWVKVISSIYGYSGRLALNDSSHFGSFKSIWNDIIKCGFDIEKANVPFRKLFVKDIGDGASTSFWNDIWLGEEAFKSRFKRLARLEIDLAASIRVPAGRARGELESLNELLAGAVIDPSKQDSWRWRTGNNGIFTTKSLTGLIEEKLITRGNGNMETLRNNLVPKKIKIFVWRARRKRLPTLVELDKRGIDLDSIRCPLCDDDIESVDHSLFLCKHVIEVWNKVFNWWGCGNINPRNLGDLFTDTSHASSEVGKRIWQAVTWSSCYLI
ncbi:uncharacterized protein [Rutidosis leptorrhynchoides]|uniref:uncharacterized protein n=1 Tax=Rutidosis leptorrhynchoides TaxID=125765 RepID=UPI003A9A4E9F